MYQIGLPYIIPRMMIALYTLCQLRKSRPHTELPRMERPQMVEWALFAMILTCRDHSRWWSMKTPRYHVLLVWVMWFCVSERR